MPSATREVGPALERVLLQWLNRPRGAPLDDFAACGGELGLVDLTWLVHGGAQRLHALARDAGLRWAGYRAFVDAAAIDAELERVLTSPQPAGARDRNRPGDVFELLVHRKMCDAGIATVKALADATGYSRRALDGWLRGHRAITAAALARIIAALTHDDDAASRESFGLSVRVAAAVQHLQLRTEIDARSLRSAFARMIAVARHAQSLPRSRRDALALVLQGSASPLAVDEPRLLLRAWEPVIASHTDRSGSPAMGCAIVRIGRSSVAR